MTVKMTFLELLEAYKADRINLKPQDLVRPNSVIIFDNQKLECSSATFLDYRDNKVLAVKDGKDNSEKYLVWFTLKEDSNNEPVENGEAGSDANGEEPEGQVGDEGTQGQGENGDNAGNDDGTPSDNGASGGSDGESSGVIYG